MQNICVKLKQRENGKYRKILSTEKYIYADFTFDEESTSPYSCETVLDQGEWFYIKEMSKQDYTIDLISSNYSTVDFEELSRKEFEKIDFLFVISDRYIYFQKISKTKLVSQQRIIHFGESFKYENDCKEITIKEFPDAIYDKATDMLYFSRLETITSIFKGIDQLYREATKEETESFLSNDFICLKDNYSASNVKTANRKRIALATQTLSKLNETDKKNIFSYIGDYCPELKVSDNSFEVGSEDELKMLLYGIEQRFYTTLVGGEKRIANSVIVFKKEGTS